jgi:dethiobiotin synthase
MSMGASFLYRRASVSLKSDSFVYCPLRLRSFSLQSRRNTVEQTKEKTASVEGFFVTGTDTDVGKTVVSAWLLAQLDDACYWKPVQAGTVPETDSATVSRIAEPMAGRILPEAYVLPEPMSPHETARRAGVVIEMAKLVPPLCEGRLLVVEGAGGLMVPLNDDTLVIDLATELHLPVILVARSTLGTINHTLLSLEAIRRRGLPLAGVVINGPESPHNRAAIERYGQVEVIAEIPWLDSVDRTALRAIEPEIDLAKLATLAKAET